MYRRFSIISAVLLAAFLMSSCGDGGESVETDDIDPTDIVAEDSLIIYGHTAGAQLPDQPDHGSHSGAFMILEETRAVANEANDRIREIDAALEDIR